jgi:iron uptake system component EfeO
VHRLRLLLIPLAIVALGVALTGCGDDDSSAGGGDAIEVLLTDKGCDPAAITTTAGKHTFHVANDDAEAVSEFEILDDHGVVGEVENLPPGLDGEFSVNLKTGSYVTYCPGGDKAHGTLEVEG